ncbi:hypothetical protein U0070_024651 [Myodes glareolus]|uniref:Uncharacterized protein n=1 Tax=Myodes glareolus TaxID=447135 RepID=A0AAW0JWL2_MYOGA
MACCPPSCTEWLPQKRGARRRASHPAINEVVTREYIVNIHKHTQRNQEICMKEMGTQDSITGVPVGSGASWDL